MSPTCISTVRGLTESAAAISWFVLPCATSCNISSWRRVQATLLQLAGRTPPEPAVHLFAKGG